MRRDYELDEDELIHLFCSAKNCNTCEGADETGEPNGYGCPALEKFLDQAEKFQKDIIRCCEL